MTAIRVVVQGNYPDLDAVLPQLREFTQRARSAAGNLQAEDFRGNEFPNHHLHLQLWENAAAFDAYWSALSETAGAADVLLTWQAPHHHGKLDAPRRQGENGIEIYRQVLYSRVDSAWVPADESERPATVRFPAWGPVRIVIQGTSPEAPAPAAQLDNSGETRLEPGCIQFEHFRSVDYPENTCLMELWESPEIYDIHWLNRLVQQAPRPGQPPAPPRPQAERRYGRPGMEWYAHNYFTLVDNVWQPEDTARRMITVQW